ncbi:hypothetical protein EJ03DRAFT_147690 [Teratosphaeria nubilosa]|uniref:Uncharacterized protein n=1 Tax=Teratosphaeria nubilosa TaxID=161662 RepID=A0A6G1L3M0_9PEZI|nr:hypothetical protein EJ03DRAFT_147690 [Teratosphaeria nubilosa]
MNPICLPICCEVWLLAGAIHQLCFPRRLTVSCRAHAPSCFRIEREGKGGAGVSATLTTEARAVRSGLQQGSGCPVAQRPAEPVNFRSPRLSSSPAAQAVATGFIRTFAMLATVGNALLYVDP